MSTTLPNHQQASYQTTRYLELMARCQRNQTNDQQLQPWDIMLIGLLLLCLPLVAWLAWT